MDYNFNRQEQNTVKCVIHSVSHCHPERKRRISVRYTREKGTKSERRMPRLSGGDERRGKLRKGSGNCKQVLIRASLNGATHMVEDHVHS